MPPRRTVLFGMPLMAAMAARAQPAPAPAAPLPPALPPPALPPIVFVHGDGDSAAIWMTTIWRFESNGVPADRLFALDAVNPSARAADDQPMPGRSSVADVTAQIAGLVASVRRRTGADKVVLVAQSRGGNLVRNYLKNAGGAAFVSAAVLAGATSHGVFDDPDRAPTSEYNGASAFIRDLNALPGEVVPGVRFLTIRSEADDKYAQPDGRFLGRPGTPTHVGFAGPALAGAENVVIAGIDHRETGFSPQAFAAMWRFLTGAAPATTAILPQPQVTLDGKVSGFVAGSPTNIGMAGARVQLWRVDPATAERQGTPLLDRVTAADGMWGPLAADPAAFLEFAVTLPDGQTTHVYRSAFPRSTGLVNLRIAPIVPADPQDGAMLTMTRPRGYFGRGRDLVRLDGTMPADIPPGVPTVASTRLVLAPGAPRTVIGLFRDERIAARSWPGQGHAGVIELTG